MNRICSVILIITLLMGLYRDAEAAVPIAVAAVAAGATLLVAAGATSYYQNSSGASAAATAAGNLYSNVTAYTNAVSAVGQAVLYSQAAALKVAASDLLSAIQNSASGLYDTLKSKLTTPGVLDPLYPGASVGEVVPTPTGNYKVTSPWSPWNMNVPVLHSKAGTYEISQGYLLFYQFVKVYNAEYSMVNVLRSTAIDTTNPITVPPPTVPIAPSAVPAALGAPNGGVLPADVAADLNDVIKANPSIAHPVNGTATGYAVDDNATTYSPDLPAGTTLATQPSSTTATQVPTTSPTVVPTDAYPSTFSVPLAELKLDKWREIYGVMQNTFPFSLLTTVSGYLDVLVSDPVAPVFDFPIYGESKIHVDLSIFDPVAALTRWIIGLLITVGAILGMQKWWRGVS